MGDWRRDDDASGVVALEDSPRVNDATALSLSSRADFAMGLSSLSGRSIDRLAGLPVRWLESDFFKLDSADSAR